MPDPCAVLRLTLVDATVPGAVVDVRVEVATWCGGPAVPADPSEGGSGPRLEGVVDQLHEALDAALPEGSPSRSGGTWWVGRTALAPSAVLGSPPLLQGAVLRRGDTGTPASEPPGAALELHVVGGPDAGRVVPLTAGRHVVGRGGEADVRLADPDLSRRHLLLTVGRNGAVVTDLGATNPARLDGEPVAGTVALTDRSLLRAGSSTLAVRVGTRPRAATRPDGAGHLLVHRSPRSAVHVVPRHLTVPEDPAPPDRARLPWATMLVPLLVAVPMALLWSPWALLMGLASPLMAVATVMTDRRDGRRSHRAALADAAARRQATRTLARQAVREEEVAARHASPDPAALLAACIGPSPRLWERQPEDPDVLHVSVGRGRRPSSVHLERVPDGVAREAPVVEVPDLQDVPLCVPLADVGVLGVAGPRATSLGLARWLVLQVAALHAPTDVAITVLAPGAAGAAWSWARWLPHAEAARVTSPARTDEETATAVEALAEEVARRTARTAGSGGERGPRHVVVLDGGRELRGRPGVAALLRDGPAVGVHLVCVAAAAGALPPECRAVVRVGGEAGTEVLLELPGDDPRHGTVTAVGRAVVAGAARALAPLRDAAARAARQETPAQVRLLDLLAGHAGARGPRDHALAAEVLAAWRAASGDRPVPIGRTAAGPLHLDLRTDGPHALVAGTTGAGKSELLRTLVLSLAWHHAPQDLSFVLVDYKGGAAFAGCAALPHVAGIVTDLDHHLTARALRSLGAEVARRERLLRQVGAADLAEYRRRRGPEDPPLGRLVLVVDEFRVLAEELPDFVAGLVRLAAVGRSLGIHLVLATQRPAGVVGPDIAANVNLRIALRVRDEHDSLDVVEARDAAHLPPTVPGRALLRTGGSPLVEVQVASVSARPPVAPAPRVRPVGAPGPAAAHRAAGPQEAPGDAAAVTGPVEGDGGDLPDLVAAVRDAARWAGATAAASPWLPPLPDHLPWRRVPPPARPSDPRGASEGAREQGAPVLRWGLVDDPAAQSQRALEWDLSAGSGLLVVGGPRSGRTGVASAVLTALATQTSPDDVHAHVLDSSGALRPAEDLPHVGAVVGREDPERALRLLRRLAAQIDRRAGERGAVCRTQRDVPGDGPDPLTVLVVDGWDVLAPAWEQEDGQCADLLRRIVREGPGAGVLALVTGDRTTATGPLGSAIADRLVLRTADPTDALMVGLSPRDLPGRMPPGRGVRLGGATRSDGEPGRGTAGPATEAGGAAHEVQVAVPEQSLADLAQHLTDHRADAPRQRGRRRCPPAIPAMPDLVLDTALPAAASGDGPEAPPGPGCRPATSAGLPLGLGGDDVGLVRVDRATDGPTLLVAGHPGSGRTTTLAVLARAALAAGRSVVAVAPRADPGDAWAAVPQQHVLSAGADLAAAARRLVERVQGARAAPDGPPVVLVDDADVLDGTPLGDALEQLALALQRPGGSGPSAELLVLAASTPALLTRYTGPLAGARQSRSGLLLGPSSPLDGDVVGISLPRRREERRPGRGLLVRRGRATAVQVAVPDRGAPVRRGALAVAGGAVAGDDVAGDDVASAGRPGST